MSKRKHRKGEHTCNCTAYNFPHRFGGGKCTGFSIVEAHWSLYYGYHDSCQACDSFKDGQCDVINGVESFEECEVFQEFINYNEIKVK